MASKVIHEASAPYTESATAVNAMVVVSPCPLVPHGCPNEDPVHDSAPAPYIEPSTTVQATQEPEILRGSSLPPCRNPHGCNNGTPPLAADDANPDVAKAMATMHIRSTVHRKTLKQRSSFKDRFKSSQI